MVVGIVAAVVVAAVLVVAMSSSGGSDTRFADAAESCESPYVEVLDDGAGLGVQTEGEDQPGADWFTVLCVVEAVEMPDAVVSRMERTRALDGTQDAEWDGVRASWTYHPDSGMSLIMEHE